MLHRTFRRGRHFEASLYLSCTIAWWAGFEDSTVEQGLDTILATVNAVVQRVKEYEADVEPVEGGAGVPVALTPGGPPPAADAVSNVPHLGVVVALCTVPSCARVHRCRKRLSQTPSRISLSEQAVWWRVWDKGGGGGGGALCCCCC
jgi:hypothetical protein